MASSVCVEERLFQRRVFCTLLSEVESDAFSRPCWCDELESLGTTVCWPRACNITIDKMTTILMKNVFQIIVLANFIVNIHGTTSASRMSPTGTRTRIKYFLPQYRVDSATYIRGALIHSYARSNSLETITKFVGIILNL